MSACAAAAVQPSLAHLGDGVLLLAAVACAGVMWHAGGRSDRGLRGWRMLALSPVLVGTGAVLAAVVAPVDPVDTVVLRWVPAVPGYALAIVGGLALVGRARLRGRGARVLVELGIFTTASVVTMRMIFLGPGLRWSDLTGA